MQGDNFISSTIPKSVLISYNSIIYKSPNKTLSLRSLYNPKQYLFLIMSPSTNKLSGLTKSTETTTLAIASPTSYYVTQTEFATTIKSIMDEFKKEVNKITAEITDQDNFFDNIKTITSEHPYSEY